MAKVSTYSRYNTLLQQTAKRKAIIQHGMVRSDSMRNFMASSINSTARLQVQTTEMQLRSNAQAAAKAKMAAMFKTNKLA